jgi:hypothetical protein
MGEIDYHVWSFILLWVNVLNIVGVKICHILTKKLRKNCFPSAYSTSIAIFW